MSNETLQRVYRPGHKLNIFFTGCATGFGAYVRERLLEQGHVVCGVGHNGPDYRLNFDFDDESDFTNDCGEIFRSALTTLPEGETFDILINNAGWTHMEFTPNHDVTDYHRVIKVNEIAPWVWSQIFTSYAFQAEDRGDYGNHRDGIRRIVNTGSMSIRTALRSSPGYVASKAGIHAQTRTLSKEFAGVRKVAAFTVSPATVEDTAMVDEIIDRLIETRGMTREEAIAYNANVPMRRWCTHEECWRLFNFAINDAPEYCSGTNFEMLGGIGGH